MSVYDLIRNRRTVRRFAQKPIALETLKQLVDAGRLAPSASNLQPLEFMILEQAKTVQYVFERTRWAGYLPPDQGKPGVDQAPVAFILILVNKKIRSEGYSTDVGAAAENMILTALEQGVAACWIGSIIDRTDIKAELAIPDHCDLDSLLALGYPAEDPVAEPLHDSVKYYRDEQGRLHVPKRILASVLHINGY